MIDLNPIFGIEILIPPLEIPKILFVYAIAFSPPNTGVSRPRTF